MNVASMAAPAAASAPPAAPAVTQPALGLDDAGCARTRPSGGAAPPTIASVDLRAKVHDILTPYKGVSLTPPAAAKIRAAFCQAGVWSHPGLDQALAGWGLSVKQLEALAPAPPGQAARHEEPASGAVRRIPPRE